MQEVIQMHIWVYRARASVGAVIHTDAPHLTVFAVANQSIPLVYEPLLRFGVTEPILDVVQNHPGLPALLMANHGALVFHKDPVETARLLATLDEVAE